jgi:hypothetical protein
MTPVVCALTLVDTSATGSVMTNPELTSSPARTLLIFEFTPVRVSVIFFIFTPDVSVCLLAFTW